MTLIQEREAQIGGRQGRARLSSVFQPVYSLTHCRVVGHEALLRVRDDAGASVPPNEFFASLSGMPERARLDLQTFRCHLEAHVAAGRGGLPEWLFLNIHPASLLESRGEVSGFAQAIEASGIPPERLVIEVLESPLQHYDEELQTSIARLRSLGCLIAIDDFGAGHSNFERVFQLTPQIVKLDRHVLLRAKQGERARKIVQRMVSLLHECGALVLMEGIETLEGARIALSCDVDFVQGYFFARPDARHWDADRVCPGLEDAWETFVVDLPRTGEGWRSRMAGHCDALRLAAIALSAGGDLAAACAGFLSQHDASMCYLLDADGRQLADPVFADGDSLGALGGCSQFEPLHDCKGARWSRRPYFRRALTFRDGVQLSRPYLTLQGACMCFTASIAFDLGDRVAVLCGDIVVPATMGAL